MEGDLPLLERPEDGGTAQEELLWVATTLEVSTLIITNCSIQVALK